MSVPRGRVDVAGAQYGEHSAPSLRSSPGSRSETGRADGEVHVAVLKMTSYHRNGSGRCRGRNPACSCLSKRSQPGAGSEEQEEDNAPRCRSKDNKVSAAAHAQEVGRGIRFAENMAG